MSLDGVSAKIATSSAMLPKHTLRALSGRSVVTLLTIRLFDTLRNVRSEAVWTDLGSKSTLGKRSWNNSPLGRLRRHRHCPPWATARSRLIVWAAMKKWRAAHPKHREQITFPTRVARSTAAWYALIANRYMHEYGVAADALAAIRRLRQSGG